jgi:SAM-dependent methyltransferase
MRFGRIAKSRPLSTNWGFDRGKPVDRFFIERFLTAHSGDIRGHVLEVAEDLYSSRLGGDRLSKLDILSLHDSSEATIVGDLTDPATLPAAQLDCIILTQTFQLLFDLRAAVANLHRALRPGGVLLLTAPAISPIDRGEWKHSWYWSFTEASIRRLLSESFDQVEVSAYGNLAAASGFLHGAAVEDVGAGKLAKYDPAYPVIVAARAVA